jgi:hypothetical protein
MLIATGGAAQAGSVRALLYAFCAAGCCTPSGTGLGSFGGASSCSARQTTPGRRPHRATQAKRNDRETERHETTRLATRPRHQ